jgi:ferredoxin-type protein NapH
MSASVHLDALPPQRVGTEPRSLTIFEKFCLALVSFGSLMVFLALLSPNTLSTYTSYWTAPALTMGTIILGGLGYVISAYKGTTPGIKHNGMFFSSMSNRGVWGWMAGIAMTSFYVILYWHSSTLSGAIALVEPISYALSGKHADQWFLYGFMYTVAILVMGSRMLMKYRHSRYQIVRTLSVMFFQLGFGFLIPNILKALNQPEFYFTYFWPLKPEYLLPWTFADGGTAAAGTTLITGLTVGRAMLLWAGMMSVIAVPTLTYFFGKRWYCSFVCGCGGLAETLGDPYRQLSDNSDTAWKVERWMIHSVLLAITVITGLLWINAATGNAILGNASGLYSKTYGFFIGAAFSGVIGVGFYPIMGSRVWCRFGCPQAAILGMFQRFFSRFRITTNGGQCISCGNCSTYCEMGIDVRAYAQRGENIVRASCVGCGVCSDVCPRGVLKLENGSFGDRFKNAAKPFAAIADAFRGKS